MLQYQPSTQHAPNFQEKHTNTLSLLHCRWLLLSTDLRQKRIENDQSEQTSFHLAADRGTNKPGIK
jgi:hypothetical protein